MRIIKHIHFKLHSLKEILKMVEKSSFMASLDIKDAYCSIPINESSQKYLKLCRKNNCISSVSSQIMKFHLMSQMVYKAIEITISRAQEIKT